MIEEVAREYGFKHTLTTADIARAIPSAVPFWKDVQGNTLMCKFVMDLALFPKAFSHGSCCAYWYTCP
jgi:hypothetical protein